MNTDISCPKCGCKEFVLGNWKVESIQPADYKVPDYKIDEPGKAKLKRIFCCGKCGWELPYNNVKVSPTVTITMTPKKMEEVWFDYVVSNKYLWCPGMTLKRLEKVKSAVLADKDIMFDLLQRHNANEKTPEEMKTTDAETFYHCRDNFICNILYKMMEIGLVKH